MGIVMDGITYRVAIKYDSRTRSFSLIEGKNAGQSMLPRAIRDIRGTAISYVMNVEPDPRYPDEYDAFFEAISAPVEFHTITMPYGQETITFDAQISSGSDVDGGVLAGHRRWHGLQVAYTPMEPQVIPDEE